MWLENLNLVAKKKHSLTGVRRSLLDFPLVFSGTETLKRARNLQPLHEFYFCGFAPAPSKSLKSNCIFLVLLPMIRRIPVRRFIVAALLLLLASLLFEASRWPPEAARVHIHIPDTSSLPSTPKGILFQEDMQMYLMSLPLSG